MNSFISMISGSNQAAPVAPPLAPVTPTKSTKTSFSSVLDRTLEHPSDRGQQIAKSNRARASRNSERPDVSHQEESPAERRPVLRDKEKIKKNDSQESLAGACAVSGEPVKIEASAQAPASTGEAEVVTAETATAVEGKAIEASEASETTTAPAAALASETETAQTSSELTGQAQGELLSLLTPVTTEESEALQLPFTSTELATGISAETALVETKVETTALDPLQALPVAEVSSVQSGLPSGQLSEQAIPPMTEFAVNVTMAREAEIRISNEVNQSEAPETVATSLTAGGEENIAAAPIILPVETQRTMRAARAFRPEMPENAHGISVAQHTGTMKTVVKKEEVAGVSQQLLPGSAAAVAALAVNLSSELRRSAIGSVPPGEIVSDAARLSALPASGLTPTLARTDVSEVGKTLDTQSPSPLVRVSELLSREVRMFKRGGDDLVEVVLTPDAKTQISLRLQWREGQVEVQARCDFGDYRGLNTEWPQLQASMANHGVRLSHLSERTPTGLTDFFSNPGFSQRRDSERQESGSTNGADKLSALVPAAGKTATTPAATRSTRMFDSWA